MGRGAVLVLLGLAGLSGGAAAQEPEDTTRVPEAAADTAAADTAATPPAPYEPPRWAFSLTTGFTGFGDLQTQGITALVTDPEGETSTTLLRRDIDAEGGVQVGASAVLSLTPAWAVRAGVAWGRGRLTTGLSGADEELGDAIAALSIPGRGSFRLVTAEAAVRFRTVSYRRAQPFLELGAAALRWDLDGAAIPGGEELSEGQTRWAGLAAVGAIVPVWPRISGRIQLSGHVFRSPLGPVPAGPLASNDSLTLTFDDPEVGAFADPQVELTRILRLDVGLSLEVGRIRPAAPPRSEADAPPRGGSL